MFSPHLISIDLFVLFRCKKSWKEMSFLFWFTFVKNTYWQGNCIIANLLHFDSFLSFWRMLVSKQNKDVYIDKLNDKLKTLTLTFPVLHKLKMRWNIILILQNVYNILRRFVYIKMNTKKDIYLLHWDWCKNL